MSNALAVAAVTEVLGSIVLGAATRAATDFDFDFSTGRPEAVEEEDGRGRVNLFLYQVMPNPALRNRDLPTRRGDGGLAARPGAALDLHYLLSFSGPAAPLVGERLMGAVVSELHACPVLDRQRIRDVIAAQAGDKPFLAASDLAEAVDLVRFTPLPLDLEELSKLWSVFFQVPYSLSLAYRGSAVVLEPPDAAPQRALPVRGASPPEPDGRRIVVAPFRQPVIEEVADAAGRHVPIVLGSELAIRGRDLRGELTAVALGGHEIEPAVVEPGRIVLDLSSPPLPPAVLRAGIVAVQVVHRRPLGDPPVPHRGVESNVVPFVLRPRVAAVAVADVEAAGDLRSAQVELTLEPELRRGQRLVLLLNELDPPGPPPPRPPRAYSFELDPAAFPENVESTAQVVVPIARVRPDDYLVRVQVDGAESPLALGVHPDAPPPPPEQAEQYVAPRITIP